MCPQCAPHVPLTDLSCCWARRLKTGLGQGLEPRECRIIVKRPDERDDVSPVGFSEQGLLFTNPPPLPPANNHSWLNGFPFYGQCDLPTSGHRIENEWTSKRCFIWKCKGNAFSWTTTLLKSATVRWGYLVRGCMIFVLPCMGWMT